MCLEDRPFFSACAHANQGSVTRCPQFLVGPSCPKHMVHLEIHCGFCLTCSLQLETHVPATPFLKCLDGLWSVHSMATGRHDASKPGLSKLRPQDAVEDHVDFDANRDWLATLEDAVARCEPKVVRAGLDVWNDNPWLATDEAASRMPLIARQAQLRTIRWAAELNFDDGGGSEPGGVPVQDGDGAAEEELDRDGDRALGNPGVLDQDSNGTAGEVLDEANSVTAEATLDRDSNGESVSGSSSDQDSDGAPGIAGVLDQDSNWASGGELHQDSILAPGAGLNQGSIWVPGEHLKQNSNWASGGVNQNSNWASGDVNRRRLKHGRHS